MRTLVIVHLEPDFEAFAGPLEWLVEKVVDFSVRFDMVINITSAGALSGTEPFYQLAEFQEQEWIWGYDGAEEMRTGDNGHKLGEDFIATTGHDYSFVDEWMKDLNPFDEYVLVGGARNECLLDIYEIFNHLELPTEIEESLTF